MTFPTLEQPSCDRDARSARHREVWNVLVPGDAKRLFERRPAVDIKPVFYSVRRESHHERIMRKLGLTSAAAIARRRIGIWGGCEVPRETNALWLSPGAYFGRNETVGLLDALPELSWVYSQVTATDHLDLETFRQRGVKVSNSGNLSSRRVAEMALACMLAHAKQLPRHLELQRRRAWMSLGCEDVSRQTVGIVGTGNIGREVAQLARGLGMRVIGASRDPGRFGRDPEPYHQVVSLLREIGVLLAQSDHVVVAVPLDQGTTRLIGVAELCQMKRGSSLISVTRGGVVEEEALCDALDSGRIGAAYLEQTAKLPPPRWSRLYRCPNLVLTHYSSANSSCTVEEAFGRFLAGLQCLAETGEPPDRIA